MKVNGINNTNFKAQLHINCPKDMITSKQIQALTKQAEGIGKTTDKIGVEIKFRPSKTGRQFYTAKNSFDVAGEQFTTSSDILYKDSGYHIGSNSPYYYIERMLEKLKELI